LVDVTLSGDREVPMPVLRSFVRLVAAVVLSGTIAGSWTVTSSAHAELESASPPINGTVTSLPANLTLTFSEEVKPGAVSVTVTGPDGKRADNGGAAVDLNDPERVTVIVPLLRGGDGAYQVEWQTISNIDGDQASGRYAFSVASAAGSPVNTTAATPAGSGQQVIIAPSVTIDPNRNGNPLPLNSDYDSRAFAISVGVGLLALAFIVGFWFLVRPRNPRFGPRSKNGQE
jgi:methionine-rich copper-binding protein CopC